MKKYILIFLISCLPTFLMAQLTAYISIDHNPRDSVNICQYDSVTVEGTHTGGTAPYTYNWTGGSPYLRPTADSAAFVGSTAGVFWVYFHAHDSGGNNAEDSIKITVTAKPTLSLNYGSNINVCANGTYTLTATAHFADEIEWHAGGIGGTLLNSCIIVGSGTCSIVITAPFNSQYTAIAWDGNCFTYATVNVTVISSTASANHPIVCPGGASTLTATNGLTSYHWNTGSNYDTTIVHPLSVNNTYWCQVVNGSCTLTDTVHVTVDTAKVRTSIATPLPICYGASTTINTTGVGPTYLWHSPPGGTTGSITVSPTTGTTYTVTMTDANSCTTSASAAITVDPQIVITLPTPLTICKGDSVILGSPPLATGGSGTLSYQWNPTTGLSCTTCGNPYAKPTTGTTYTVTVTDGNTCTATATVTVNVNTATATLSASPATICKGTSTIITATGGGTYHWSTTSNLNPISVSPNISTLYTVTVTAANSCTATDTLTVHVDVVTATAAASPNPLCNGNTTTITATGAGTSPYTYNWNPTTGLSCTTCAATVVTLTSGATYTVMVTDANTCSATASAVITVNANPVATATASPNLVCSGAGTTVTLTATGVGTYLWSPPGGTTAVIHDVPTATTTYTVTVTNASSCTAIASVTVTVDVVNASATPNVNPICLGQSTTITASGGSSYHWSSPPGGTLNHIIVSPATPTTYIVTVTDFHSCSATTSATINVNPLPVASISTSAIPVCSGASVTITASGANTYQWSTPPGGTANPISVNPTSTSTYTVTATDINGCTAIASTTITVDLVNTSVTASPSSLCAGGCTTLTATNGASYIWSTGSGLNPIAACPTSTTTYSVTASDSRGCTGTASTTVTVNSGLVPTISASVNPICSGASTTITAGGGSNYQWSFPPGGTANPIIVSPTTTTHYTVTVSQTGGCSATAITSIIITVVPMPTVNLTCSAISPICSGTSVTFTAGGSGAANYCFYVNGSPVQCSSLNTFITSSLPNPSSVVVIANNGSCETTSNTMNFTVNNPPSTTITSTVNPSPCGTCTGSITENTTGGVGAYSILWSNGQNSNPITNLCASNSPFSVTVTDVNGCSSHAVGTISDAGAPPITLSGNSSICSGDCVAFTAGGADIYQFFVGTVSMQGPSAINTFTNCSLNSGDAVSVQGTVISTNCTGTSTPIIMTVEPMPLAFNVTGGGEYCQGSIAVTVGLSGSQSGTIYELYIDGVYSGQALYGTNSPLSFGDQYQPGTYTIFAINPSTQCQDFMQGNVTVTENPLPTQYTVTGGGTFCSAGGGVPVGLSGSQVGIIYQLWNGLIPGPTVPGTGSAISFANQTMPGTYCVVATNPATSCTNNMISCVNVILDLSPNICPVTGGGTYCPGGTGELVGIACSQWGVNYQVLCNGNPIGSSQPGTGSSFNLGYFTTAGTYTVVATNTTSLCSDTMAGNVVISLYPVPSVEAGTTQTICQGATVTLNGSGAGVGGTYLWASPVTPNNIANPTVSPTITTNYYLTVTDVNGCTANDSVTINVLPFNQPVITATHTGYCDSDFVDTLNAGFYNSYLWNTVPAQTTQTIIITNAPGNYCVTVTAANSCTASACINIVVYPKIQTPVIHAIGDTTICQPDSVELYLNHPYYTYNWSSGSINVASIYATQTGEYYVTVTDSFGCKAVAGPKIITVDSLPKAILSYVYTNDSLYYYFNSYSLNATTTHWNFGDPLSGPKDSSNSVNVHHEFSDTGYFAVTLVVSNICGTDSVTAIIHVHKPASGIVEYSGISNMLLYPNPTNDLLNFDFTLNTTEQVSLTLLDEIGQLLYTDDISYSPGKHHKEISLATLPKGIYVLRIATDKGSYNRRIIKD